MEFIKISNMDYSETDHGWNVVCSPFGAQYIPIDDPDATEEQLIAWLHSTYYLTAGGEDK